jgi:predicted metal-dependent hydrolase
MNNALQIGGLAFEVRRSDRRKTLGLTVGRAGELVAYAPTATSIGELTQWINKKLLWVHGKLALKEAALPKICAPEYVSGESFCYLGRRFRLKMVKRQEAPLIFDGMRFLLKCDCGAPVEHFQRWYIQTGMEWLRKRVERLSQFAGCQPTGVDVRDLGFRWGSCGRKGKLFFNWKILQLPVRLVDYVILHELIHLRERNHGPAFWDALGRALPDWQERKNELAKDAKDYLVFGLSNSGNRAKG